MIELERVITLLNPPINAEQQAHEILPRILAGENTLELAEKASKLMTAFNGQSRLDLVFLCFDVIGNTCGPLIQGAVLKDGWTDGHHGSPFAVCGYSKARILRWFNEADPATLMTAEERKVFDAFPDTVRLYRGGPGPTARKAAAGISWTLKPDVAAFFKNSLKTRLKVSSLVVEATFSKDALVAYLDDRSESEVIANYRRAQQIKIISE